MDITKVKGTYIMKKRVLITFILSAVMIAAAGCGAKTLHCDGCGVELKVQKSSNMEEDWIVFCKDCEEDLISTDPLIEELFK
jgi:hypothetical protein